MPADQAGTQMLSSSGMMALTSLLMSGAYIVLRSAIAQLLVVAAAIMGCWQGTNTGAGAEV